LDYVLCRAWVSASISYNFSYNASGFDKIETAVDLWLSASQSLNLVTDESTNISGNRIINTSAITNNGDCFYISNIEAEPGKLGAEELADMAVDTVKKITKGDLSKVASWTTDTCAVMRSMCKKFGKIPGLEHVFTVSCDSHGLQLIIKDLLQRPQIEKDFKAALQIVDGSRNGSKQLSLLWIEQERVYKKQKVLQSSTTIRWGSQYNMAKSLDDSKEALRNFAYRDGVEFSSKYLLLDPLFWAALMQLLELFEPIHSLQKMSEDNKATIRVCLQ
jgi:hypothetical protein